MYNFQFDIICLNTCFVLCLLGIYHPRVSMHSWSWFLNNTLKGFKHIYHIPRYIKLLQFQLLPNFFISFTVQHVQNSNNQHFLYAVSVLFCLSLMINLYVTIMYNLKARFIDFDRYRLVTAIWVKFIRLGLKGWVVNKSRKSTLEF